MKLAQTRESERVEPDPVRKVELDDYLDQVDYDYLNSSSYVPTVFALTFMNFIKLVNGEEGESNKTPPVHLKMLDKIVGENDYILNLCFRGAAKTSIFGEYLFLFIGVFGSLPGFGKVTGAIYVGDTMENGAKTLRKNMEFRYDSSPFLQEWITEASFTDSYIEFRNRDGHRFGLRLYGAKTGIRGTKIFSKRPQLAVMDDLLGDDAAKSRIEMDAIRDTIYKGVDYALDPTQRKVILSGTPFNKNDVLIEAVESGAWDVNVWPVCEKFPCDEDKFKGAWPDRFTYKFVRGMYDKAIKSGREDAFFQEMMLRISSAEERLVQDEEIRWYSRIKLLDQKGNYNFYITTDFATSKRETADYSVISVWAYNSKGDWYWVDGVMARQTMDMTVDDLFRLVQEYKPQSVGIEITGQQGGFVSWLQQEQMSRNIWFNFASSSAGTVHLGRRGSNTPGIRPTVDKLSRFNLVVPWFKAGKIYFPEEMRESEILRLALGQVRLATINGLKGKDDFLDTVSMLVYMNAWKPSDDPVADPGFSVSGDPLWDEDTLMDTGHYSIESYIV